MKRVFILVNFVRAILQSPYFRNILTLVSGSSLAQFLMIAISPVLTRIFSPEEFGTYTLFIAVLTLLAIPATGRYELAILLPKKDKEAYNLLFVSMLVSLLFCLLLIAILPFLVGSISAIFYFLPIALLLQSFLQSVSFLANRFKNYRTIAGSRIGGSISTGLGSIILGLLGSTGLGLIIGKLIGLCMENLFLIRTSRWALKNYWQNTNREELKKVALKYQNFPLFSTPEALLNNGFKNIPVFALTLYFSPALVGFFGLAQTVLSKPLGTIAHAFTQVFYQSAAELNQQGAKPMQQLFQQNLLVLLLLGTLPALVIFFWAPAIFSFIFGTEWQTAGEYASWLIPFLFITFLKAPFSSLVDLKNRIHYNILFEALFLLLSILAFYLGVKEQNALWGIQCFSISCTFLGIVQLLWFYQLTKLRGEWEENIRKND